MTKIMYNDPKYDENDKYIVGSENCHDVYSFIGPQPPCPYCNDTGEYEDNGPHGCMPCCSRLIQFIDKNGDRVMADWGDEIEKDDDGNLTLIRNYLYE